MDENQEAEHVEETSQPRELPHGPRCGSCQFFHRGQLRATQGVCMALPPRANTHFVKAKSPLIAAPLPPAMTKQEGYQSVNTSTRPQVRADASACILHSPQGLTLVDLFGIFLESLAAGSVERREPHDCDGDT